MFFIPLPKLLVTPHVSMTYSVHVDYGFSSMDVSEIILKTHFNLVSLDDDDPWML